MTRDEMLNDKFDRYGALYMLATRWHSGQWSRGYRLRGKLTNRGYKPGHGLVEHGRFESEQQRAYYRRYFRLRHTL